MKVLHIVPGIPYGGMQRLVFDLASEQIQQGLQVAVIVLYDRGPLARRLRLNRVRTYVTSGAHPARAAFSEYRAYLRDSKPDLVHLHGGLLWSNVLGLIEKSCPWIYHAHSYPAPPSGLRSLLLNGTNRRLTDAIIGVSKSVSDAYLNATDSRVPVFTVYNGTNLRSISPGVRATRSTSRPIFGMATRFAPDKGVFEFIEVAAKIAQRVENAHFALAGDGPLLSQAKDNVAKSGLQDRFKFPGFVDDVEQFWRELDVAVFTSPREPFGLRLIEPMLLGIPVVGYLTGAGSDEVLQHGENALTAAWADSEQLATHAIRVLIDRSYASRLCERARQTVQGQFSIEKMTRDLMEAYIHVSSKWNHDHCNR